MLIARKTKERDEFARFGVMICCLLNGVAALGQTVSDATYSRLNTWSVFGEYTNDSSRILMGNAVNRKVGAVGVGYERRLVHARSFDFNYAAEWRPGMVESDPAEFVTVFSVDSSGTTVDPTDPGYAVDKCVVGTVLYVPPPPITLPPGEDIYIKTTCGRREVIEQGLSPLGFRLHARITHRVQPTLSARMGVLLASQPAPSRYDGNFNTFFDVGLGFEVYRGGNSLRLEYVLQHYGNLGTVPSYPAYGINGNPGADNGFLKLTWAFGRVR